MKKILILSLSALILLTGCRSGEEGAPDGMKTASPKEVNYILYVPEDWKVDTAEGSIMTAAHVEDGDNSNITMMTYTNDTYVVSQEDGELSIVDAYWAEYEKDLVKVFDSDGEGNSTYKLMTVGGIDEETGEKEPDGDAWELNGAPCRIYRYEGRIADIPMRYMQVISYYKGELYIFTYTATTQNDRYERNEEDVARMLDEFKFK